MSRIEHSEPDDGQQRLVNLALSTTVPIPDMLGEPNFAAKATAMLPKREEFWKRLLAKYARSEEHQLCVVIAKRQKAC